MPKLNDVKAAKNAIIDAIFDGIHVAFSDEGKFEVYDVLLDDEDGATTRGMDVILIPAGKTPDAAITFKVTVSKK